MYLLYEKPSKAYLWGTSLITRDDTYCVVCICSHYFKLSQSVTIIVRLEKTLLLSWLCNRRSDNKVLILTKHLHFEILLLEAKSVFIICQI